MTTLPSVTSAKACTFDLRLLKLMYLSREGERLEGLLFRQGKGWFQISGTGHESLAAIGMLLRDSDYIFTYYRDRALVLSRGMTNRELALAYFAKKDSSSGGRQLPGHCSSRRHNIWSALSPTGANLLPACGVAWGMKLEGKNGIVVATVGDAATRQGEFYEALSFAVEHQLPIIFVVEDNGYGISTKTAALNPFRIGIFNERLFQWVDARQIDNVYTAASAAIERARCGEGPTVLHCELDRLCSHTSSDDHRVYRAPSEVAAMVARDPIDSFSRQLVDSSELCPQRWTQIKQDVDRQVAVDYAEAEQAEDPDPAELSAHLFGPEPVAEAPPIKPEQLWRMVDAINHVLDKALEQDNRVIVFGQDVEDPKGGVFRITAGLSRKYPGRIVNSPLAEATIAGVACGLASYGMRPVFELQFVDFVGPAWNQISQNLATIRWRSFGDWNCPAVIYAPYGAYLPGGALWHSQANESLFAHTPGLRVVIPSTPEDAAGLMWTALAADDPTIFLIPKHRLRQPVYVLSVEPVPFGKARFWQEGCDVTVVSWGNCLEVAEKAALRVSERISVELIDLRSIVPWDREAICHSLEKTGRLVVVQEDAKSCSVGEMIITEMTANSQSWESFISPPQLVSRSDVHIGFNPIYERAALPGVDEVVRAIELTMEK